MYIAFSNKDKLIYIYRKIKVYDNTQRGHIILHKLPLQLWQEILLGIILCHENSIDYEMKKIL